MVGAVACFGLSDLMDIFSKVLWPGGLTEGMVRR